LSAADRDERRVFLTLDGLRGVAAVFVAMRHTPFFHGLGIQSGYLAVDLFFVLSGFVIAHAYQRRLEQGLAPTRFLALRYLRLWPVYALGAALGVVSALCHAMPGKEALGPSEIARAAPLAVAMLPGPAVRQMLYPLNTVAWSLAFELLINLVYAFTWRGLRTPRVLPAVLAVSAAVLAFTVWWFGKLDVGFTWTNAWGGLPRVTFSFAAGLAVQRFYKAWPLRIGLSAWAPLAVLPVLLWKTPDPMIYPLFCVVAVFPPLVAVSAWTEPGRCSARLFAWLGAASYPLYALHRPVAQLTALGLYRTLPKLLHAGVLFAAPYMLVLLAICVLIERVYDRPVRKALSAGFERLMRIAQRRRTIHDRPAAEGLAAETRP